MHGHTNIKFPKYNFVSPRVLLHLIQLMFNWNMQKHKFQSYVYWTVHHLYSCVKRDQLDITCFIISLLNAQHVSDGNTSILRSLRLMCWVISWVVLIWFDVCWSYVVVWLWWCSIRMQAEACSKSTGVEVIQSRSRWRRSFLIFIGPCIVLIVE